MKQLILIRHGKSSWDFDVNDKDRPLKLRGIKDGHLVAGALKEKELKIDKVYASPANRALHTCMIFMRQMDYPLEQVTMTDELYDFSGESVMNFVRGLNDQHSCILIFGHNYAFTNVANKWGNQDIDNVPTSGLVLLQFDAKKWADVQKGRTEMVLFPKEIR